MFGAGGVNSFTDASFTVVVYRENAIWATGSGNWRKLEVRLSGGTISSSN